MKPIITKEIIQNKAQYQKGDRVLLLDYNESGIVYDEADNYDLDSLFTNFKTRKPEN